MIERKKEQSFDKKKRLLLNNANAKVSLSEVPLQYRLKGHCHAILVSLQKALM